MQKIGTSKQKPLFCKVHTDSCQLVGLAGLILILMPMQNVFVTIPTLNRKAEAWTSNLDVWPASDALCGQKVRNASSAPD